MGGGACAKQARNIWGKKTNTRQKKKIHVFKKTLSRELQPGCTQQTFTVAAGASENKVFISPVSPTPPFAFISGVLVYDREERKGEQEQLAACKASWR